MIISVLFNNGPVHIVLMLLGRLSKILGAVCRSVHGVGRFLVRIQERWVERDAKF